MLTDAALKALKPKEKVYKIVDRDGMYVRVMPSGAISFRLDYRLNGRRETVYLGRYDSMLPKPPFSNLAGDEGCAVANADNSCRLDRVADSLIAISMRS
ncbi:hypothetical protein BFX40_13285 [Mesorhizobium sp. SEMIA 3007]|nr:hypothetical protein BFX40_13285 [Mesorhizobium sp. SEMIA 3007]